MTSWGSTIRGACIVAGAGLVLAACDSGSGGPSPSGVNGATTTTMAADVPGGYDPCQDIPQGVLDSLQLDHKTPANSDGNGGIKWRGCLWSRSEYYGVSVRTTNITVDMVRGKNFPDTQELTINGRRAISSRQVAEHPDQQCTIDVEIKGGSLEFFLSNPKSNSIGGSMNSCDMAREVAEKVVPTLPSSV